MLVGYARVSTLDQNPGLQGYDNNSYQSESFARSGISQREIPTFRPSKRGRLSLLTHAGVVLADELLRCRDRGFSGILILESSLW